MINVLLNLCLFALKFIGGNLSNCVSVTADAFNNLSDAVTTLLAWLGLKISSLGPGEHHPNGHGRFEWIIALLSSSSVIIVGWELFQDSIGVIKNPETSKFRRFTFVVLLISIMIKFFMYIDNSKKWKRSNSSTLKAIAADSLSDAVATVAVLLSLLVNTLLHFNIDGYCGILVSIFIVYNGFQAFFDTSARIMGRSPSKEELEEMREFVLKNEHFAYVYDLQIEDYGYNRYRTSMLVLGKEEIDGNQLIRDVDETAWKIYKNYGYRTCISLEKQYIDDKEDEIRTYIQQQTDKLGVMVKILSLWMSKLDDKKLVHVQLGIEHEDYAKLSDLEEVVKSEWNIPKGYEIIPRVQLTWDASCRRHGKSKK